MRWQGPAAVLCTLLSFCGCGGDRPGDSIERLAIATTAGVFLWTAEDGVRRVGEGPAQSRGPLNVRWLSWSGNGQTLAWALTDRYQRTRRVVWAAPWYRTPEAYRLAWLDRQPLALAAIDDGAALLSPGEDDEPNVVLHYTSRPLTDTHFTVLRVFAALGRHDGFTTVAPVETPDALAVFSVDLTGSVRQSNLRVPSDQRWSWSEWAVAPDGTRVAGVRQPGACEGERPLITEFSLRSGSGTSLQLPGGERWRVISSGFTTGGQLHVLAAELGTRCTAAHSGGVVPTRLFEHKVGGLRAVADDVYDADRSPDGTLAVIAGTLAGRPVDATAFERLDDARLVVDGATIAIPGRPLELAWQP